MHKYEIILYWSEADRAFVAEVPELPGCVAHGDTQVWRKFQSFPVAWLMETHRNPALKHINQAMTLWIDTAHEHGDPIPEPKGERLMLA